MEELPLKTPLEIAAERGNKEVVTVLLAWGADPRFLSRAVLLQGKQLCSSELLSKAQQLGKKEVEELVIKSSALWRTLGRIFPAEIIVHIHRVKALEEYERSRVA